MLLGAVGGKYLKWKSILCIYGFFLSKKILCKKGIFLQSLDLILIFKNSYFKNSLGMVVERKGGVAATKKNEEGCTHEKNFLSLLLSPMLFPFIVGKIF